MENNKAIVITIVETKLAVSGIIADLIKRTNDYTTQYALYYETKNQKIFGLNAFAA